MEIIKIVILSISGFMLFAIGFMRLLNPIKTYLNNSGIQLPKNTDILNEIRGQSAVMFCGGLLIALGVFIPNFAFTSFVIASLLFLGFALGRVVSIAKDGKPNKQIAMGIVFEFVLGAANIFGLIVAMQ